MNNDGDSSGCVIVPTITTDDAEVYKSRLDEFAGFAPRIHIDVTDGIFAPSHTLSLNQLYWSPSDKRNYKIDLHLMIERPIDWLDQVISLKPDKVILHAESDNAVNMLPKLFDHLQKFDIEVGVALLPDTQPDDVAGIIKQADSALIFGGHLGYQGGVADLSQLGKIPQIKTLNPNAVVEWDGGANRDNIVQLAQAGTNQVNVGGVISNAADRQAAYSELAKLVSVS